MAAPADTNSGEPDLTLVAELLEQIQRHPPGTHAKTLLIHHYASVGWIDAASDLLKEVEREAPHDGEISTLDLIIKQARRSSSETKTPVAMAAAANDTSRNDLVDGDRGLRQKSRDLFAGLFRLRARRMKHHPPLTADSVGVKGVSQGLESVEIVRASSPGKPQHVARAIMAHPDQATDLVIADLEETLHWMRRLHGRPPGATEDQIRDALVKRMRAVAQELPENLKIHSELGFMHIEHENLNRTYVNDETMFLMAPVKDIPREELYVTEDNYAWDMSELARAIAANDGVMRNPLSRQMFTLKDIRGILLHPHASHLAALQVAQQEMSKGVRPETIQHMHRLADIILEDSEPDQKESRQAVDEFLAYVATLPEHEQKTIDGFRCPATDSFSGTAYDKTIGQAIRQAKANEICFHKTGDFIKQAAAHLNKNRGVPPKSQKPCKGCVVM